MFLARYIYKKYGKTIAKRDLTLPINDGGIAAGSGYIPENGSLFIIQDFGIFCTEKTAGIGAQDCSKAVNDGADAAHTFTLVPTGNDQQIFAQSGKCKSANLTEHSLV